MLAMTSLYHVEVFVIGSFVSEHTIEASDALAAINLVEVNYGEPPAVEHKTVYHEDGTKETALMVTGWHGYSFLARNINKTTA